MCGIVGILSRDGNYHNRINEASNLISYRGPDDSGVYKVDRLLSLAHRRLSIVDVHHRSVQPMIDETNGNVLVFNGEVYNYKELKSYLDRKFFTHSDTEVLLYLLSDLGIDKALPLLNGMWAFAFWDNVHKRLTLSRDRFGKKPLFYVVNDNSLLFASEVKALRELGIKLRPNHQAVVNFLIERTVGSYNSCFFEEITQIEPASYQIFELNAQIKKHTPVKYWHFPDYRKNPSYMETKEEFKEILIDAVNIRLSEEVPFACMLSGGLDSSSIASIAGKYNPQKEITCISAVYPGNKFDESYYAQKVIDKYGNLKRLFIEIKADDFFPSLKKVIYHQEYPIPDGSMVAHFLLMKKIKEKGIKVLLSGNGGDEVLAGYTYTFLPAYIANNIRNLRAVNIFSKEALRSIYHLFPSTIKESLKHWQYRHSDIFDFIKDKSVVDLLFKRFNKYYKDSDLLNFYLKMSLTHWSLPGFVWYEDRNSMAYSIELRSPFLDYRIVNLLFSLPGGFKINTEYSKRILRDALNGILPEEIRTRKDKQGFFSPIEDWKDRIDYSFLTDKKFSEYFNYIDMGKIATSDFVFRWRVFTLYMWYQIFIS